MEKVTMITVKPDAITAETKSPEHQKEMRDKIGEVFDDMEAITVDMVKDMTPEDKQKYQLKLQKMMQKIQ